MMPDLRVRDLASTKGDPIRVIELQSDELIFGFPELLEQLQERVRAWVDDRLEGASREEKEMLPSSREGVHRAFAACLPRVSAAVSFQRTLRMPENGRDYPLPLGLGRFSIYPVDDFPGVPQPWQERGGVMLPMHPAEALWLSFYADYPMALRVGAGGNCAVSGQPWPPGLESDPQNYVVLGSQPWLDGFHAGAEVVRQFVARPMGRGVAGVHALSGEERWGGLQLQAFPLRPDEFWRHSLKLSLFSRWDELMVPIRHRVMPDASTNANEAEWTSQTGGRIRLKILADPYGLAAWDTTRTSRCFAHLCLAEDWQRLTGIRPPQKSPTPADYREAGVPWGDFENFRPAGESNSPLGAGTRAHVVIGAASSRGPFAVPAQAAPRSIVRLNPDLRQTVREF